MSDQSGKFRPPGPHRYTTSNQVSPRQFTKSGSEQQFWDRCEEAAILRIIHKLTWKEIAERLDICDKGAAHRMVSRYLTAAARFFPAVELREALALRYRHEAKKVDREYKLIEHLGDGTEKRLACIARSESLIEKEARLYGLVSAGAEVNIHLPQSNGEQGTIPRQPVTPEERKQITEAARELRARVCGTPVDASFTTVSDSGSITPESSSELPVDTAQQPS